MKLGGQEYSNDQISSWLAGKSQAEITAQAASMGLSSSEIQQAMSLSGNNTSTPTTNVPMSNGTAVGTGNFYGYNGNSYSTAALDPNASSFLASNGQTYTKQQINDWYNAVDPSTGMTNRNSYGSDQKMQAQLGLQSPDLYKARFLGGTSDTSTGIYTANAEMAPYGDYLKGAQKSIGTDKAMSFYDWRAKQDPAYLSSLAKGATGNLGYMNGPAGGVPINYGAGDGASGVGGGHGASGGGSSTVGSSGFGGYGGGSSNLGIGGSNYSSYSNSSGGINPYLDQMAGSITNQMQDNYNNSIAPANRSGAMVAGGFGGSRQGVIDSNSAKTQSQALGNSLANLYGTGWQNAQQNSLQNKSLDNSYALGVANNNLGFANLDSNNAQFGANYGLNVMNSQNNWANSGVNAATNMQNTPTNYATMFNNNQNAIAGQGSTSTSSQMNQGNPWLGALGGAQLANQWLK